MEPATGNKQTTYLQPEVLINTGRSKLWKVDNYSPDFFVKLLQLLQLLLTVEPEITVMGKICRQRRNVGFFSDESTGYRYSGQTLPAFPLSSVPFLKSILQAVNLSLGTSFNGILVNSYINGEKYIGAHSDNESGLDKGGRNMVVSIAYGAVRTFRIRDKETKKIVLDYPHTPGTLLVMEGDFQKEFTHEIPVQKKVKEERISLTFRHHTE